MALTNRSAKATIVGLAAIVFTVANPNFEAKDMARPYLIGDKITQSYEIQADRIAYGATYLIAAISLTILGYSACTGNLRTSNSSSGSTTEEETETTED